MNRLFQPKSVEYRLVTTVIEARDAKLFYREMNRMIQEGWSIIPESLTTCVPHDKIVHFAVMAYLEVPK